MKVRKKAGKDHATESPSPTLHIPSDPAEAGRVRQEIVAALEACHYSEHDIFGITLALEEALINAIKHGNRLDPAKQVHIEYQVREEHFEILIADEGPGFDPSAVPDPTSEEGIERACGRGLLLMNHYMSEVTFNQQGNAVRMRKVRKHR